MNLWARFHSWLRGTLLRSTMESEMDDELRFHIEARAEDLVRSGLPRPEAMRQARLQFGGMERAKEECREARGVSFIEKLGQDLRYGARTLRKSPGFTVVAVLTLALGIGANTAIFSLVDGILLAPLPFSKPDQLVSVTGIYPRGAVAAMREQVHSINAAAYSEGHELNLTGQGEPTRLTGTMVSAELFSLLGARPELGRTFYPGEDVAGQDDWVILSHALWQQRFGSDPSIIGRAIEIEGVSRQVIGVMPADFRFPSSKTELWVPLHNDPRNRSAYWAGDFMPVVGRLQPGVTMARARAEIHIFQSHVGALFPWPMPAKWNADVDVVRLRSGMVSDVRTRLLLLLGAVALVLLIACANVANLTLSRAATREKEIAIRSALGAGRRRIVTQLVTESVLLASLGGGLGLLFATSGLSLLKKALPADTPRLMDVHLDWRVLTFTATLAVLTGFVFGLAPALQASRGGPANSLKSSGRGNAGSVSQRLRGSLVVAEVAFAVLLVISAGLLIRSFWAISHQNPGFQSEQVVTARITPNESFCSDNARCIAFYRNVVDQVQSSPGITGAALVNTLPLGGRVTKRSMDVEDYVPASAEPSPLFWLNTVTPHYFRVMGIPILAGRDLTDADASGNPPVALVTESTARRYWSNQNAVGKHIRLLGDANWHTVVGVTRDLRAYDLQRNAPDWIDGTAFIPYSAKATLEDGRVPAEMTIAVRTTLDESRSGTMLQQIVTGLNQEAPVSELKTMRAIVSEAASTPASTTSLFVAFAGLALVLGIIGIYGVLAFLVSKRTREIAIRVALGAQRRDVLRLIMKEGAKFSFAGITLGLVGAFAVTRLLASELYGVSSVDPLTYMAAAGLMAVVTLLSCYIPTRRAMQVDPLIALREE
jgi:putative ABC transport system permease protein